jgi:hypothetical protein
LLEQRPEPGAQNELLGLLRTKGLSIKNLDEQEKEDLREFLDYLHNAKGLSLNDIAKLIGNKTSGYASWLCKQLGVHPRPFEEARLKGIREKRRKYERKPFDGTEKDKAYLLGLRHGDLSVSRRGRGWSGSRPARHIRRWRNCSGRSSSPMGMSISIRVTRRTLCPTNGIFRVFSMVPSSSCF